jgi:uncharacterized protein involved in exopolysaccharide biosynthesis
LINHPHRLTYAGAAGDNQELADEDVGAPAYSTQSGMSITQVVTIAKAYWRQSVVIAFSVIVLAFLAIKLLPKTYTATATLIVNSQSNDPLAAQRTPDGVNNFDYVATQVELMSSPVVLLPVVDKLSLTTDRDFTAGFRGGSTAALREYAERVLEKQLDIETGRGGQLIYVAASARYPDQAATIANAIADVYVNQERQRLDDPAAERAQRYSQELAELRAKAEAAQQAVTDFRKQNGLTDLNETTVDNESQALTTLETRLLDAQNQRRALEARQTGSEDNADEALASEQIGHLKLQLGTLRQQEADLETTMGPRNPKLLAVQAQIAETQSALDKAVGSLSANTDTQLARARDLETRLTQAIADEHVKVLKLRQLQDSGQKLSLELESAQSVYKRALDGYDQIMFASVDHANDVSLISRATAPIQPSKPNKIKLFLAGIAIALVLALLLPLTYELFLNRRLRCRDDIERGFGLPVLAQFDSIPAATSHV